MKGKPLVEYRFEDVRTLYDVLPKGLALSNNGLCLGEREGPGKGPYKWLTYSQVLEKVRYIASGLVHKNIEQSNATRIGIYAANRSEWIISEHACYSNSLVVVSLYDSYGKSSIKYILNHAELKAVFVDTYARLMNILEVIDELPHLNLLVHFNSLSAEESEKVNSYRGKVDIVSFEELLEIGRFNVHPPKPPRINDIATICYTSGTTGIPKGALISHLNIIANEAAIFERVNKPHLNYNRSDPPVVHMSYLPLAHMLERQASVMSFLSGGKYGFISGDITKLADDCQVLKPTDLPMVPRLLNKLYNSVTSQVNQSSLKRILFNKAIEAKEADRKRGIFRRNTIYDKLVFNKIREKLGGNLIRTATGSAPISDEVLIFSKAALGCPIPEGYGQTEATCSVTFTHPFDPCLGHCGAPVSCYMVKLVDVPEMGYFADQDQGEICAKGPSRFVGYLKDEEKTAEVIDKDGWLHTGDIGMWLPNGTLKIIDRKKNLFKLSQGEYISPEKVENVYIRSQFLAQVYVEGDSLKDFLVAVVVPDEVYLTEYCRNLGISGTFEELCENRKVRSIIMEDLQKFGKAAGLMSYEQVKNIYLHSKMMTLENGLATPTMKIKRQEVRKYFQETITNLYKENLDNKSRL